MGQFLGETVVANPEGKACFFKIINEKGVLMCAVLFRIHLDQIDEMGR